MQDVVDLLGRRCLEPRVEAVAVEALQPQRGQVLQLYPSERGGDVVGKEVLVPRNVDPLTVPRTQSEGHRSRYSLTVMFIVEY